MYYFLLYDYSYIYVQFYKFCSISILQVLTANLFQIANKFFLFDFLCIFHLFLFHLFCYIFSPFFLLILFFFRLKFNRADPPRPRTLNPRPTTASERTAAILADQRQRSERLIRTARPAGFSRATAARVFR